VGGVLFVAEKNGARRKNGGGDGGGEGRSLGYKLNITNGFIDKIHK